MPLPQAPREGGEWKRSEHFAYVGTAPNTTWHGYLAGPVMWFECHQPKKTKPCLAILTGRAVVCPWCRPEYPIVQRGYVPLYRQSDWAPRCVIVNDLYRDLCDKLTTHERVTLGKESVETDPVWITRAMSQQPAFNTTLRHRFNPVDLTESLLRIWGNSDLVKWWAEVGSKQSDNAMSLTHGVAVNDKGHPVEPMLQAAAKRAGFNVTTDPTAVAQHQDAVKRLMDHAASEGTLKNGHGKKKPKGGE